MNTGGERTGGRPQKPEEDRLTERIMVGFTVEEHRIIQMYRRAWGASSDASTVRSLVRESIAHRMSRRRQQPPST